MNTRNSYVAAAMRNYQKKLQQQTQNYYVQKSNEVFHSPESQSKKLLDSMKEQQNQHNSPKQQSEQEKLKSSELNIDNFLRTEFNNHPVKTDPKSLLKSMKTCEKTQQEIQEEQLSLQQKQELQRLHNLEEQKKQELAEKRKMMDQLSNSLTEQEKMRVLEQSALSDHIDTLDRISSKIDKQYIIASFLDLKNSSLCLNYDSVCQTCQFSQQLIQSQQFYEFIKLNINSNVKFENALNELAGKFNGEIARRMAIFITEQLQQQKQFKLPRIVKRQRSCLQRMFGSDDAFVQLAGSYIAARLSGMVLCADPYRRFPILCEAGQEMSLQISVF